MDKGKYFHGEDANKFWGQYFAEVDKHLKNIPYEHGKVIRRELESHAFEAAQADSAETELERLKTSFSNLGKPEDIVPPMVAEALIEIAQKSHNPLDVIRAVTFQIGRGIMKTCLSIMIGILALLSGIVFIMAFAKPFAPENVGLYTDDGGTFTFGIIMNTGNLQEHLGYSIVPIGIVLGLIFYRLTIYFLKYLK